MLTTVPLAVWIVEAAVVLCFLVLIAYRAHITRYEEDQLFLSEESGQNSHAEQDEIVRKVNMLSPFVRATGGAAGLVTVGIIGMYVWGAVRNLM